MFSKPFTARIWDFLDAAIVFLGLYLISFFSVRLHLVSLHHYEYQITDLYHSSILMQRLKHRHSTRRTVQQAEGLVWADSVD